MHFHSGLFHLVGEENAVQSSCFVFYFSDARFLRNPLFPQFSAVSLVNEESVPPEFDSCLVILSD